MRNFVPFVMYPVDCTHGKSWEAREFPPFIETDWSRSNGRCALLSQLPEPRQSAALTCDNVAATTTKMGWRAYLVYAATIAILSMSSPVDPDVRNVLSHVTPEVIRDRVVRNISVLKDKDSAVCDCSRCRTKFASSARSIEQIDGLLAWKLRMGVATRSKTPQSGRACRNACILQLLYAF